MLCIDKRPRLREALVDAVHQVSSVLLPAARLLLWVLRVPPRL